MKAVLMAFSPEECEKIFSGKKTVDVRKIAPKLETSYKVYVYDTKKAFDITDIYDLSTDVVRKVADGRGKVVGEFVCDKVIEYGYDVIACAKFEVNGAYVKEEKRYNAGACLSAEEMYEYSKGKSLRGLHITKPKRYDTPKDISEFSRYGYQRIECVVEGCGNEQCKYCEPAETIAGLYKPSICRKGNCIVTRPPQSWMYVEEIEE